MINLLPTETRDHYIYARRNVSLIRWAIAFVVGLAGIVLVVGAGHMYIDQSISALEKQADVTKAQLEQEKQAETQARVNDISSSLKLSVQVLSKQVLFSNLIQQVGAVIPPGAALTNLRIEKLEGGIDLQFAASNYETGTQIQVNLEDPQNKIFDKADIIAINCTATAATDPRYPCTVNIRASFTKNNPFLFIAPTTGAQQ